VRRRCVYLAPTMLRRILTALALLTGLAAAGVPAEARLVSTVTQQVEAGAQGTPAGPQTPCTTAPQRNGVTGSGDQQADCRPRRPVIIYLPTVQLGTDRALE